MAIKLSQVLAKYGEPVEYEGTEYPVHVVSANDVQLASRVGTSDAPGVGEMFDLAKRLCPTLPAKAWDEDAQIIGVIIGAAQQPLRAVQAELPNSSGPATTASAPAIESHAP